MSPLLLSLLLFGYRSSWDLDFDQKQETWRSDARDHPMETLRSDKVDGDKNPSIGPMQGVCKDNKVIDPDVWCKHSGSETEVLAFSRSPGGVREFWEAGRNHSHLSWHLSVSVVTSHGRKPGGFFFTVYRDSTVIRDRTLSFLWTSSKGLVLLTINRRSRTWVQDRWFLKRSLQES